MQIKRRGNRDLNLKVWTGAFSLLVLACICRGQDSSADKDIARMAEQSQEVYSRFLRESFELRMGYEFSGSWTAGEKKQLRKMAVQAAGQLGGVAEEQRAIKGRIEDYEGGDWEERYGATGLWRKVARDVFATELSECEIDLYMAMALDGQKKKRALEELAARIGTLREIENSGYAQLLAARVLAALAVFESEFKVKAKRQFAELRARSDMAHSTALWASIEEIKFSGKASSGKMDDLVGVISGKGDVELAMGVIFLRRRLDGAKAAEKTLKSFPRIEGIVGQVIVSKLARQIEERESLESVTVFEAELAAAAALNNGAGQYRMVMDHFASQRKFERPLILYAAAAGWAQTSKERAVDLLVRASWLQKRKRSRHLEMESWEIAEEAVRLAYNEFVTEPGGCEMNIKAFENYLVVAGERADEELEYLYIAVLGRCGRITDSQQLLERIAERKGGKLQDRARLDLIIARLQQGEDQNEIAEQLWKLISEVRAKKAAGSDVETEAVRLYCRLALESDDSGGAQKALDILESSENSKDGCLAILRARALRQMGRLEEAAGSLVKCTDSNDCAAADEAMELLGEIDDRLEEVLEDCERPARMVKRSLGLAKYRYGCQSDEQAGLLLAEMMIVSAGGSEEKLSAAGRLLDSLARASETIDFFRCRARLAGQRGEYEQAARLWGQVCQARKTQSRGEQERSWKWWRAKFYELQCWAKSGLAKAAEIAHTIEVLENSWGDIPQFWAEKLGRLKEQVGGGLSN